MKKFTTALISLLLACLLMTGGVFAADNTGTITINQGTTNVSLAGTEFTGYQILTATAGAGDAVAYQVPTGMQDFYRTYFSIADSITAPSDAFNSAVSEKILALDAAGMQTFAKAALTAAKAAVPALVTVTATGTASGDTSSAVFSNVPYGYYLIEQTSPAAADSAVSALMINTAAPDATITVKADAPTIKKEIDVNGSPAAGSAGSIGDTVSYNITGNVPDMTGYSSYSYVLTDTLSKGLTFQNDVAVSIGQTTLASDAYTVTTATVNDQTVITITLKDFIQYASMKGQTISIRYNAVINSSALVGDEANPNSVKLTYSNNPEDSTSNGTTPDSTVNTYTTQITVQKNDQSGNPLTGAEFTLTGTNMNVVVTTQGVFTENAAGTYYLLPDGTYSTIEPSGYTGKKYALETQVIVQGKGQTATNVSGYVDANGQIVFKGLGPGTYTLTETVVPNGYNGLDPVTFTIGFEYTNNTPDFTITPAAGSSATFDEKDNLFTFTAVNNKGQQLPNTGLAGTTIMTLIGAVLVIGAAAVIVTRQKMKSAR